jgi:hypothetical protein
MPQGMRFTVEMETQQFNKFVARFIREANIETGLALKKIGFDLLANILKPEPYGKHPVDTGRARAAWYPSMKSLGVQADLYSGTRAPNSSKGEVGVQGGMREGRFIDKTSDGWVKNDQYIEMVNSVFYILPLEYGWSRSAPAGMVRISMRKMSGRLPTNLNDRYLKAWNKARGQITIVDRGFTPQG